MNNNEKDPKPATEQEMLAVQRLVERGLLMVWDADSKKFKQVESVCMNGLAIQLNVEVW